MTEPSPPPPSSAERPHRKGVASNGSPAATRAPQSAAHASAGPNGSDGLKQVVAAHPPLRSRLARPDPGPRVDRQLFRPPSGRRASAGRVIGVGLICFGLWAFLDANQLYHNALASPTGARRSASVAILRPIAATANAIGISALVNWGNSGLGRTTNPGSVTLPSVQPRTVDVEAPPNRSPNGLTPYPHVAGGRPLQLPTTTIPTGPPPIPPPTTAHPITILDIGDSIGADLGLGLGDLFSNDPYVRLVQKAQIDTGLARPDYFNWPSAFQSDLTRYHPAAAVIMLGANDEQALNSKGVFVSPGTPAWKLDYASRVALLMDEALAVNVRVVWVGLPPMQGTNVSSAFAEQVNAIVRAEAAKHPGVTFVPSWNTLATSHGGYAEYLRIHGSVEQIRSADGVHLYPAGYDLLAHALLAPMQQAWHVNLHVS